MPSYLDPSAIVKYYVTEPGSAWVREQVDGGDVILLSEATIVEVAAALGILHRMGRITSRHRRGFWERFERDCVERYDLTPVAHDVIYAAAKLCANHPLRAYGALQLAAGLALRRPLTVEGAPLVFVWADDALVSAAESEGLAVDNPLWHTDLDAHNA